MNKNYVVYHLHTELSLLDSCTNHKLYIDKAKSLGQKAIAFTEHGNIYKWIEKKMYCDKQGIKYIHGVECYITMNLGEKIRDNYHTILLAKNYEGVKEINSLIDLSSRNDHFYYKPRISVNEFLQISSNVVKISSCLASPLNYPNDIDPNIFNKLCLHYDYYEIQPHINSERQKRYNLYLLDLSQKYGKPLIAGTDTHSLDNYKAECRKILQKAKHIEFSDEDEFDLTYKSYSELTKMFELQGVLPEKVYLEAIENTNILADSIENFNLDLSMKYPKLYENEEKVFKERILNKCQDKLKLGIIKPDKRYLENIKEEMRVFKKIGMIGFMLFMSDLMTWCRENNIPSSPCRGSVGGSTIAYITDITDVDPVKWGTVFSRFANEDRIEIGDIDIDIAPNQRELVYEHIINGFGKDYTAYVLAIGTISDKGTIDEIGRAFNMPLHSVAIIKSEYEANPEKAKKDYPKFFYYFDGLLGTAVSQSIHPAGIIVSPLHLPSNYGTFWDDNKRIICIDMEEAHEVSLVKYDILALKNIQIINETCKLAGIKYPLSHEVDWNDKNVWNDMLKSSVGIFQFEGDYAFSLLKQYKPERVNDLSLINAVLRPSGASFRDRLLKKEFNKNPSSQIDELLKENNGFLVFQEDTIKFLTKICGLSGSQADNVRRAIGRKQKDRLDAAMPKILEGYCLKSDKPKEQAENEAKEFLQIIEDSSRYQFGYNHSTGYSMLGFLCAYMRYYYPIEFLTAYLNCADTLEDINKGTELAEILKIKISSVKFEKSSASYTFDKVENIIYKGVGSIKFLNDKMADELYSLSQNNKYKSFTFLLQDINNKTSCNSRQVQILITLNYFRDFGKNKKLLEIFKMYQLLSKKKQVSTKDMENLHLDKDILERHSKTKTNKMFKDVDWISYIDEISKPIKDECLPLKEQIKAEIEYLGSPVTTIKNLTEDFMAVIEFKTYKDKHRPYITLYILKTGEKIKTKITDSKLFSSNPFKLYDILKTAKLSSKKKIKNINGKWIRTDEDEKILTSWEVC